jgi:hypothetical protein
VKYLVILLKRKKSLTRLSGVIDTGNARRCIRFFACRSRLQACGCFHDCKRRINGLRRRFLRGRVLVVDVARLVRPVTTQESAAVHCSSWLCVSVNVGVGRTRLCCEYGVSGDEQLIGVRGISTLSVHCAGRGASRHVPQKC